MPFLRRPAARTLVALTPAFLLFALAGGCTSYEYDIVRPTELAKHVGSTDWVTVRQDPLEYRFFTSENRLVVQVYNRTADAVRLVGDRSVAVDPDGQSHPLKSQTIAAGTFVKLILPPMPNRVERSGPSFGIGVGVGYGRTNRFGYDDPYWADEPRYYSVVDPNDTSYWEWNGDKGEARLTLAFERDGKPFTHEFAFTRRRV